MRRWVIVGAASALATLSLGTIAWPQEDWGWQFGEHRRDWRKPRVLAMLENEKVRATLGLTDQQSDRLRQIMVDRQKSAVRTGADISVRRIELRELLGADNPDREAVIKKVQEISDLRAQMMRQHVESLLAAKAVLTPEQQKKMRALIETRVGGWRERPRPPLPPAHKEPVPPPTPPPPLGEPPVE